MSAEARQVSGAAPATMRQALGHPLTPGILLEQEVRRRARKAIARARYLRRYARHAQPARKAVPALERQRLEAIQRSHDRFFIARVALPGFEGFMKALVVRLFGSPGKDGKPGRIETRGRWHHATRKGPGRRALKSSRPAGSKLWRRATGKHNDPDAKA